MRRTVKSKLRGRKTAPFLGAIQSLLERPLLLYGGVSLLLLLASIAHVQKNDDLSGRGWSFMSPVLTSVAQPFIAVSSFVTNISSYQKLQADYKLLTVENERLMEWYHMAQLLKAENQSLKSLLNVQSLPEQSFITARILSDPATPYVKSVLLDIGVRDGVTVGQAVLADTGMLGRIVDVQDSISRVLLLSDINSRVPVTIEGTSQKGVVVGRNMENPLLFYTPDSVTLEVGMLMMTSGDGGMLPVGLPVGRIDSIEKGVISVEFLTKYEDAHFVRVLEKTE